MFFVLFAALTVYLSWHYAAVDDDSVLGWLGALSLLILFLSVLLHEFGHYWAAVRLGGGTDQMVLGPLGGLVPIRVPYEPRSELAAILAGPMVNLIVAVLCFVTLLAYQQAGGGPEIELAALLNPLGPPFSADTLSQLTPTIGLQLTLWINWCLFLVNLIPAFPFDGGRALLALFAIGPPGRPVRRPVMIVATIAKVVAIGLLIAAWFVRKDPEGVVVPTWFALVLLSIFLFFSARVEESQQEADEMGEELFGYDFSQGYTSLERPETAHEPAVAGPLTRWRERRRQERLRRQAAREAEDDRRMDDILARLHETGMENLSAEERALLIRVSARYRSRERK
jgi:Zn-dependent protease